MSIVIWILIGIGSLVVAGGLVWRFLGKRGRRGRSSTLASRKHRWVFEASDVDYSEAATHFGKNRSAAFFREQGWQMRCRTWRATCLETFDEKIVCTYGDGDSYRSGGRKGSWVNEHGQLEIASPYYDGSGKVDVMELAVDSLDRCRAEKEAERQRVEAARTKTAEDLLMARAVLAEVRGLDLPETRP